MPLAIDENGDLYIAPRTCRRLGRQLSWEVPLSELASSAVCMLRLERVLIGSASPHAAQVVLQCLGREKLVT
jgi:hypothetical protein